MARRRLLTDEERRDLLGIPLDADSMAQTQHSCHETQGDGCGWVDRKANRWVLPPPP